ncbi:cytochrome c oxidase assembly protein [Jeotgalibacillus sp. S-D1]|uniref:cytochrome c oxidase assembly protein n=1 Tax=Jeotgalibacillus sp. S-D1 TaxID=2552189 RepID=UPI00105A1E2C|nr:cytochrome c oxidase assembly protein [Jeotgalibacillus sp. S-D1]TDL30858.1 cytochrome c oxidase assembly protein [Jeotgalibacillus sp. S-D1]
MHHHHTHQAAEGILSQIILGVPFLLVMALYCAAVLLSNRRYKPWPLYRTGLFAAGALCAAAAVAGPLAERAHMDFTAHMMGHLLLGMLAPLLMVLAAPVTLILRTLPVTYARRLSRLLKTKPASLLTDPVFASVLNIGGLWLLYTTDLYQMMHQSLILHVVIHLHVFIAGYLFTASMIYIDPTPHRTSYVYRTVVLVIALAGHGILSKYIYANPPAGTPASQAESGSVLMFYGGDLIDAVIITILCYQWYKAARPRTFAVEG